MRDACNAARVLAAVATLAGLAADAAAGPADARTLALEARRDHLVVVRGAIGDIRDLRLAIDTGTTQTMVDVAVAERLGLERSPARVLNLDRWIVADRAEVGPLEVGPLTVPRLPVLVTRLSAVSSLAEGVDAIVGLDVLRRAGRMRIDYSRRTLELDAADCLNRLASSPQILTMGLSVQGRRVTVVLDTGLQDLLLYGDRLRRDVGEPTLVAAVANARAGRLEGVRAVLRDVGVGPDRHDSPVFVMPRAPRQLDPVIDGYAGPAALNFRQIEVDFSTNTLRWR